MKNNLDTPVAKQCRALYTKYAYGHTYSLLKVALCGTKGWIAINVSQNFKKYKKILSSLGSKKTF